jgi:SAM-dependent methyltransferase
MLSVVVSNLDVEHLRIIRASVVDFMKRCSSRQVNGPGRLLDIAPQVHEGARPFFPDEIRIDTFDLDQNSGCTIIGDICEFNAGIPDDCYDYIVCTEVLEHTLNPFDAMVELRRILKPSGKLFLTTPFNFRIHGPLPDCWRFTEHGLRSLLRHFIIVEMNAIETESRALMPIHYTVVAQKPRK